MERRPLIGEWEGSAYQKWAKNFCYRNQWRVQHILGDYQDCLAECALHFIICKQRYGSTVNTPQQFMYMFQLWVTAEFDTYSVKDSKMREVAESISPEESSIESEAHLAVKLQDASSDLKTVINLFMNAPQEIMEVLRKEASSHHPKQFWKSALRMAKIDTARSSELAKELEGLLS